MWFVHRCQNYVDGRMDGLYDISLKSPSLKPLHLPRLVESDRYLPPLDQIPDVIQTVVGKYGNEINGHLGNLYSNPKEVGAIDVVRKHIETASGNRTIPIQQYVNDLPEYERLNIYELTYGTILKTIADTYPNTTVLPISEMNEIGAHSTEGASEIPHIDGVFAPVLSWFPGIRVLRCILGIQGNNAVDTLFPLSGNTYTLDTGNFVAFDYNRAIYTNVQNRRSYDGRTRMVLKLHYVVFPAYVPIWLGKYIGNIHAIYNAWCRTPTNTRGVRAVFRVVSTDMYVRLFLVGLFFWRWMGFSY